MAECDSSCCRPSRRDLLASAAILALPLSSDAAAAPASPSLPGPKPTEEWLAGLFRADQRKVYTGPELETIGMPCGGVAAGQLYVRGDGTLAHWMIFNNVRNTGYGDKCYRTYRPESPLNQGFAIRVKSPDAAPTLRTLSRDDFDAIEFVGEYPIAEVRYKTRSKPSLPLDITSEIFSPFIPLNARESAFPAAILRFTLKNTSTSPLEVSLAGWLQNGVLLEYAGAGGVSSRNRVLRVDGATTVQMDLIQPAPDQREARRITVFEDFESGNYDGWTATGDAFGNAPATGAFPSQQQVSGWHGKGFVNTFRPDDRPQGTLTSRTFKIAESFIAFLIGGGSHAGKTCMNLLVDGKVVRTATGQDNEALRLASWNVSEFIGKEARLEIVDKESGPWGHINVDYIYFTNQPPLAGGPPEQHAGFGDMSITALDPDATATAAWTTSDAFRADLADDGRLAGPVEQVFPVGAPRCAAVASAARLAPGEQKTLTFLITWYFPNRPNVGNMYANWFKSSVEVAQALARDLDRLAAETRRFRDAYLDTTLPYWLMARLMMPVSTLATETVQWWKNGRFYAWEGVGCCHGTCTHVWNYDHAGARLFPELERSTRLMQDLSAAFDEKTGLVGFRGDRNYAADGQCGTVLKVYREHLMSADRSFLDAAWPRVTQVLDYSVSHDANQDGIIEDTQHNTYDINFEGPNTFVGSLYLAALRAGEAIARLMGDTERADRYRSMFEKGSAWSAKNLWNGEYFMQIIPKGKPDRFQYGNGCLADQVFGQGWSHQVGLGYIYPRELVLTALRSVYRYCWTSDTGPYNQKWPPQRWFIRPGEAGLLTCTWPHGGRPAEPVLYRDEVWTGIEYQVANHMLYEGMVREAFAIVRGIHDRYDGARHNPWNEVECGDHYARAMASWGCLLGVSGFIYDGPAGRIGFAPRLTPERFKSFFTAAEGWGSLVQDRQDRQQANRIQLRYGRLRATELVLQVPAPAANLKIRVIANGQPVDATVRQEQSLAIIQLRQPVTIQRDQSIDVTITW